MDREGENPRRTPEKTPDRLATFEPTQAGAFPYRVLGEQHGDPVGVVLLVAQGGIARFQVADRLGVLQSLEPPLQPFEPRRVR